MSEATNIRPFTMVHNDMWSSKIISTAEKEVLATLKTFCNKNNECFPTVRKIADRLGCCVRKIRYVIKSLKEKNIIKVKPQYRKSDNSQSSNFIVIYDLEAVWKAESVEEIEKIVNEYEEKQRVEAIEKLKDKPTITKEVIEPTPTEDIQTKEKEIEAIAHPAKGSNKNQSQAQNKTSNFSYNNAKEVNCQDKKDEVVREIYSMEFLKEHFNYDVILMTYQNVSERDLEAVFNILYDTVNTSKETIRVAGENMPAQLVKSKLLKLDYDDIEYVITKYNEYTGRVYNQRNYLLTLLYRAKEQQQIDMSNKAHHDLANTDWSELRKKREELQAKQTQQEDSEDKDTFNGSDLYSLLQKIKGHKRE